VIFHLEAFVAKGTVTRYQANSSDEDYRWVFDGTVLRQSMQLMFGHDDGSYLHPFSFRRRSWVWDQ
jgi:hypothetical protein